MNASYTCFIQISLSNSSSIPLADLREVLVTFICEEGVSGKIFDLFVCKKTQTSNQPKKTTSQPKKLLSFNPLFSEFLVTFKGRVIGVKFELVKPNLPLSPMIS